MNQDENFDEAIKAVAPSSAKVFRHLLVGAYARVDIAERRAEELESQRAELICENAELKRQLKKKYTAAFIP